MWEGVGDGTEQQHIDPHSIDHNYVSFPFSWAAQPGAWGPTLLGADFLYRFLSPTGLVSKLTDFLSSPSYIIVQRSLLVGVKIALIQPVHGQGYNILILLDRMHLLFTQVHFLFWLPCWVVGQYTTNRERERERFREILAVSKIWLWCTFVLIFFGMLFLKCFFLTSGSIEYE